MGYSSLSIVACPPFCEKEEITSMRSSVALLACLICILLSNGPAIAQEENRAYMENWFDVVYRNVDGGVLSYTQKDGKELTLPMSELNDVERESILGQLPENFASSDSAVIRFRGYQPNEPTYSYDLGKPTFLEFTEISLYDVVETIAEKYEIKLYLDHKVLKEEDIGLWTPIDYTANDKPLEKALQEILGSLNLTVVPYCGTLMVTTRKEAARIEKAKYVPVPKLPEPVTKKEARLRDVLRYQTELECCGLPLHEVVDYLSRYHGIAMRLDRKVINRSKVKVYASVGMNVEDIALGDVLTLMLRPIYLTWRVEGDKVLITRTEEKIPDRNFIFHNPYCNLPRVLSWEDNPFYNRGKHSPFGVGGGDPFSEDGSGKNPFSQFGEGWPKESSEGDNPFE